MYSQAELGLESVPFYEAQLRNLEQVAHHARRAGDTRALAGAELNQGRIKEKLQDFAEAIELAEAARSGYGGAGDESGVALCCHTLAVWAFHQGDDANSLDHFHVAAETNERAGELLLGAQSWHNLGYVQCRGGRSDDAFHSYQESRRLLDGLRADPLAVLAIKADRGLGFVFSHLAFASAKYRSLDEALTATVEYFEHVARTNVHREPLLAYLAPPIALTFGRGGWGAAPASRLNELTGLQMEPEAWFQFALEKGRRSLLAHEAGSGRRPYLGARLLTLAEYGTWCLRNDRSREGKALLAEAVSLALARGWKGEARRFSSADLGN